MDMKMWFKAVYFLSHQQLQIIRNDLEGSFASPMELVFFQPEWNGGSVRIQWDRQWKKCGQFTTMSCALLCLIVYGKVKLTSATTTLCLRKFYGPACWRVGLSSVSVVTSDTKSLQGLVWQKIRATLSVNPVTPHLLFSRSACSKGCH